MTIRLRRLCHIVVVLTSAARHGLKRLDGPRREIVDGIIANLGSRSRLPRDCVSIRSNPRLRRISRRDVRLIAVADDGPILVVVGIETRSTTTYRRY